MRTYARVIFGLNAVYQLAAGAVFLFAPVTAIGLYGFPAAENASIAAHVAVRALGAYMLVGAGVSVVIARNPDTHPVLLPVMGALSVLTLVCWGLTLSAGEVVFSQVGLDVVVQVLLVAAVLGYSRKATGAAVAKVA